MVVNRERIALFLLNYSIAIYVRDAGVAGSNPATPTRLFSKSFSETFSGVLPVFPDACKAAFPSFLRPATPARPSGARQRRNPQLFPSRGLPGPDMRLRPRGAKRPGRCMSFRPGGRRECRTPDAPDSRVCRDSDERAHASAGHTGIARHSPAWFHGLLRALPGDRAFLHHRPTKIASPRT